MRPYDKPWKKTVFTLISILAGNALLAFLVAAFIVPHDIVMGGTTGIGIVLHKLYPNLDISLVVLVMNIVLLVLGLILLGKKFFFATVLSSVIYPLFLGLFQRIPGIEALTDNSLLAAVFAGCLMGIALGLVMRVGSSTGGIDVLNLLFHKWTHLPVALFVYLFDVVIIGVQAFVFTPNDILLGIVVLVLETLLLDRVMIIGKSRIELYVVSSKYEEIRTAILDQLEAGVTMSMIETGLLSESQKAVMTVIPQQKLYNATEMIRAIDPHAFMTVTKINEVRGRGFTLERMDLKAARKNAKSEEDAGKDETPVEPEEKPQS